MLNNSDRLLWSYQAAALAGVDHDYFLSLGLCERVGSGPARVKLSTVLDYMDKRDADRREGFKELARITQEFDSDG